MPLHRRKTSSPSRPSIGRRTPSPSVPPGDNGNSPDTDARPRAQLTRPRCTSGADQQHVHRHHRRDANARTGHLDGRALVPSGRNPRIEALVAAARRGVQVRLLLDAYYDDPLASNGNTAACLYINQLELSTMQCRLANTTGKGIHAKVFLIDNGDEQWVHLGSINGSEVSNKVNRELALQTRITRPHTPTSHPSSSTIGHSVTDRWYTACICRS